MNANRRIPSDRAWSKALAVSRRRSTVGSANLDWRSFLLNSELNAVVLSNAFGARTRAAFEADLAKPKEVTRDWRARPANERLREMFSRLWQYWL